MSVLTLLFEGNLSTAALAVLFLLATAFVCPVVMTCAKILRARMWARTLLSYGGKPSDALSLVKRSALDDTRKESRLLSLLTRRNPTR